MVDVWKEVLCRGWQRDRHGRRFRYTGRHIHQADRNVSRMLSRGIPIPAVWEHQDVEAGDPAEWKAQYAKYTFGHVIGRRINARGNLDLLHRVPDPADERQLAKTRFCSPKVYPSGYSDSRGGEYRGAVIAHVAATPTPVQTWQRPWPVQLSRGKAFYLSYSPEGDPVPDDADDKKKKAGEENAELSELIQCLRDDCGLNIPDMVTSVRELIIACKASGGSDKGDDLDDLDDDADPAAQTTGATAPGGGAPMLMSDKRAAAGYAKLERAELKRRVNRLFSAGKVDRPTAQKLLRQADAVELSFTRDGALVPVKLVHQVEAYEALPKGSVWSRTGRERGRAEELSTTEVDAPEQLTGKGDPKGQQEATDLILSLIPGPAAKK